MKGSKLYECKEHCSYLCKLCHNTKNRALEKMCECDKKDCKDLKIFMQCLMTIEGLCNYINICCCEQEELSKSIIDELSSKCNKLTTISDKLLKNLTSEHCEYLNCEKIKEACKVVKKLKTKSKTKKK